MINNVLFFISLAVVYYLSFLAVLDSKRQLSTYNLTGGISRFRQVVAAKCKRYTFIVFTNLKGD